MFSSATSGSTRKRHPSRLPTTVAAGAVASSFGKAFCKNRVNTLTKQHLSTRATSAYFVPSSSVGSAGSHWFLLVAVLVIGLLSFVFVTFWSLHQQPAPTTTPHLTDGSMNLLRAAQPLPTATDFILNPKRPLKIVFIHQNFPALGHDVTALHMRQGLAHQETWNGVQLQRYDTGSKTSSTEIHPFLQSFEAAVIRGEACHQAARELSAAHGGGSDSSWSPDVVIAHPGWGESLFIKDAWPNSRLGMYAELFYGSEESNFDPEFSKNEDEGEEYHCEMCRLCMRNANNYVQSGQVDAALSPTNFQADTFPEPLRSKISVIFDGIDTNAFQPNPDVTMELKTHSGLNLKLTRDTHQHEIVTFCTRNLEPYRGYHIFMRSLPELLRRRPRLCVILIGADGVSYGAKPPPASNGSLTSWKEIFKAKVRDQISSVDWERVHYVGKVDISTFEQILQLSTVHVYLTIPFVLSWSVLECMASGCTIVGSDTAPVREVVEHDVMGRLFDFFDTHATVLDKAGHGIAMGVDLKRHMLEVRHCFGKE